MPREVKNWAKREVWISHLFIFANIKSKFSEKSDFEARPQSTPSRERDIRNLRCKLHIISSNQLYRILPYPLNRLNVTFKSVKTAKSCTSWRGRKLWIGYLESKRFFKRFFLSLQNPKNINQKKNYHFWSKTSWPRYI